MSEPEGLSEILTTGDYQHVRVERHGFAAYVTLARPDVHNAFNARLIAELQAAFQVLGADDGVRAIVLRGDGPSFCAGADLNWMRASLDFTATRTWPTRCAWPTCSAPSTPAPSR